MRGAPQRLHARNLQPVRPETGNPGPHLVQQEGQVGDMRFAGRVENRGLPPGQHRRHQHILRGGHAGFIQHDGGPFQFLPAEDKMLPPFNLDPQRRQPHEMRVEPAATDHIAAWRGQRGPPQPRRERTGQQNGGPHLAAQFRVQLAPAQPLRAKPHRMIPDRHVHPDVDQQLEHGADIIDQRDILEQHRLIRQHRRRQHWQHGILVAARRIDAGQPLAAMNDESRHD
jgi:hypothetical protein